MKDPIDAFAWLLDAFHRYSSNQITWRDVRTLFAEADALRDQYDSHHRQDAIDLFAMALRTDLQRRPSLHECTEEFLRGRMIAAAPLTAAGMCFLLWQRERSTECEATTE
jgi:hypothetical protein